MKTRSLAFMIACGSLLAGCATTTDITPDGKRIMMVQALTATESEHYQEIGPIHCSEIFAVPGMNESCKNQLRNQAAAVNADIIVIESQTPSQCLADSPTPQCVSMDARAYKKKATAM